MLRLQIDRSVVHAKAVQGHRIIWAGEAAFDSPETLRDVIANLATEGSLPAGIKSLRIKLEAPLVQVRTLEGLPPVRDAALKALVAQQAGRFFRKNGKPLVTDAVWMSRVKGRSGVAQAVAVEEPWVDAIGAGARTAGLVLEEIRASAGGETLRRLSLLSPAERALRRRAELLAIRRVATIAGSLWLVAVGIFGARLHREHQRLERELIVLEEPVRAVTNARRKLGDAARMVETIELAERGRGAMLLRLAAIAAALPDSAYLTSLELGEHGGTINGLARQAAGVVAALERQGALAAPKLVGPVVREVAGGRELERFTVSFAPGRVP